jgi:hypothetical protein
MSRGDARTALKARIVVIVSEHDLPYRAGHAPDPGEPPMVDPGIVVEQFAPVENDGKAGAPRVFVRVGQSVQKYDATLGRETKQADVEILVLTDVGDNEQGYRDAENLIEAVEIDLIANPYIGDGAYQLVGPWTTNVGQWTFPLAYANLTCSVRMTAVQMILGPDGRAMEEDM